MPPIFPVSLALVSLAICPLAVVAQSEQENPLRRQRMELLESRTSQIDVRVDENDAQPLGRGKTPILRWSNPVREFMNDGLIFLWLERKRPRAVVACWARSTEADLRSGELWREFVSLSGKPLILRHEDQVLWSPRTGGLVDQVLADAPVPHATPTRRLTQMREIARRFHAKSYKLDSPNELRLLPQPLYRYDDQQSGILDGALFAFAEGNDPEALLLLEASARDNSHVWRYMLARMTSYRVVVDLDGREVFAVTPYWKSPRSPNDPYVSASDGPFALVEAGPAEITSKPSAKPE